MYCGAVTVKLLMVLRTGQETRSPRTLGDSLVISISEPEASLEYKMKYWLVGAGEGAAFPVKPQRTSLKPLCDLIALKSPGRVKVSEPDPVVGQLPSFLKSAKVTEAAGAIQHSALDSKVDCGKEVSTEPTDPLCRPWRTTVETSFPVEPSEKVTVTF